MSMSNFVKAFVDLEQDESGYPPVARESLWVSPVEGDVYTIENVPFFIRGLALGDRVLVGHEDAGMRITSIVAESGHGTVRILFSDAASVQATRDELKLLGCSSELSHLPRLVAVDIPPDADRQKVQKYLDEGEAGQRWQYEVGVTF